MQEFGSRETNLFLLHSPQKNKRLNTVENYYIQVFHKHNMIAKKQTHKGKKPLFEIIYNI